MMIEVLPCFDAFVWVASMPLFGKKTFLPVFRSSSRITMPSRRAPAPAPRLVSLSAIAKSPGGKTRRKNHGTDKATFDLVQARYQKGDKTGQLTGAIYYRGKPRFGNNERYKQLVEAVMLAEKLRWNDELKLYTGMCWSDKIAAKILNAMRQVRACCR